MPHRVWRTVELMPNVIMGSYSAFHRLVATAWALRPQELARHGLHGGCHTAHVPTPPLSCAPVANQDAEQL